MPRNSELRPIILNGDVALVHLTRGFVSTIDAADIPLIEGHNWTANVLMGKLYAGRTERGETRKLVLMHRLIMGAAKGVHIDHRDGDGLNNCRSNLREATVEQNMRNIGLTTSNRSGLKGVHQIRSSGRWRSIIRIGGGKRISLGVFTTKEEAYNAYAEAAAKYHGDFARV